MYRGVQWTLTSCVSSSMNRPARMPPATARWSARRTRGGPTDRLIAHTRPAAGARVRLPFFSRDLLEDLELEIAVGHQAFQPTVFLLQLAEAFDVRGLERAEMFPPAVN